MMHNFVAIGQMAYLLRYGDFSIFSQMAAVRHLGSCAYLDHPRIAFGAKFGWNRCRSFDNTQVLILNGLGLKMPIHTVTTLQLLRATYFRCCVLLTYCRRHGLRVRSPLVWDFLWSDGVTMDDVSVCVVRKSKMFIVSRVVPFVYGNNLSSTVM